MRRPEWLPGGSQPIEPHILRNVNRTVRRKAPIEANWKMRLALAAAVSIGGGLVLKSEKNYMDDNFTQLLQMARGTSYGQSIIQKGEEYYYAFNDLWERASYDLGYGPSDKPFETPPEFVIDTRAASTPQIPEAPTPEPIPTPSTGTLEIFVDEPIPFPPEPPPKPQFILPNTHILLSKPQEGEGSWTIAGLPTTKDDLIMGKTFIRPDSERLYANVSVIVFDSSKIELHMIGGKGGIDNPGGGKGLGRIPDADMKNILVAMNGGFQKDHGPWGMFLDGIEYKALKPGYATIVTFKDGSIKMGTWGKGDLKERTEDMVAIRQNVVLLVENGEVTQAAKDERNVGFWGRTAPSSPEFIAWRSAIGMTKDGNLMIATGSSMSVTKLAEGLVAAGAETAMPLDMNLPWVLISIYMRNPDGTLKAMRFMEGMSAPANTFEKEQIRDIMVIVRKEESKP